MKTELGDTYKFRFCLWMHIALAVERSRKRVSFAAISVIVGLTRFTHSFLEDALPVDFLAELLAADLAVDLAADLAAEALVGVLEADFAVETLAETFPVLALVGVTERFKGTGLLEADLLAADFLADTTGLGLLDLSRDADLVADFLVDAICLDLDILFVFE